MTPALWVPDSPAETRLGLVLSTLVAAAAWASSGAVRMVWLAVVASALLVLVVHAASRLVHATRWSREAWTLLERVRPDLIGHADITPILHIALTPAPAILGCTSVELRLAPRRTTDGIIARATDEGELVVRPMVGEPAHRHDREPGCLVLPLLGAGSPPGQLVLHGLSPRIPPRRRDPVSATFTHMLSTALGAQRWRATQRRETDQAHWLARHDQLTSLATRVVLAEQGDRCLAGWQARGGTSALLLVDLDDFKDVNDTLGHGAGDQVLAEVGRRLRSVARPDDLAVRLGGDELVLLAGDLAAPPDAEALARRLIDHIGAPLRLGDLTIEVSASVGIATHAGGPQTVEDLLLAADLALYDAKAAGRGQWRCTHTSAEGSEHPSGPAGDRGGAANHEGVVHYEAQASASTGDITGFVATPRWDHPEPGLLTSSQRTTAARLSGRTDEIDRQLLDVAIRDLRRLHRSAAEVSMSVYVTPRSLLTGRLVDTLSDALARHDVPAHAIVLEITEPAVDPPAAMVACLTDLARLGCRPSIRGFGSGPSSLAVLSRHRAIAEIKLAPVLCSGITSDPGAARLVRASVTSARELGIQVVAEGVASIDAADVLSSLGCDRLQGPLLHAPAPLPDVLAWLGSRHGHRCPASASVNPGGALQSDDWPADTRDDPLLQPGATMP